MIVPTGLYMQCDVLNVVISLYGKSIRKRPHDCFDLMNSSNSDFYPPNSDPQRGAHARTHQIHALHAHLTQRQRRHQDHRRHHHDDKVETID